MENQEKSIDSLLHHCLFFTANRMARIITDMAEEEFRMTGVSPSYAFLLMIVNDNEGVSQKDICERLHLAPSTVTRFIDKLEQKELVERIHEGKISYIYPTERGRAMKDVIAQAWNRLYNRYSEMLGEEEGDALTLAIDRACDKLE